MGGSANTHSQQSDSELKTTLERLHKPATPEAIAAIRALLATKFVYTQTHANIVLNKKLSPADFRR